MSIDLVCFTPEDVAAIAKAVELERTRGAAPPRRFARLHRELVFRDEAGAYYALGISTLKTYRWSGKAWDEAASMPKSVEGPASLLVYVTRDPVESPPSAHGRAVDALAFLSWMTEETRRAYYAGEITLHDAETLLGSFFAVDNAGRFWASGAFTGSFYVHEEKRWQRANAPKTSAFSRVATIADGEVALSDALYRFIAETDGVPPEALTAAWQPPVTSPEPLPVALSGETRGDIASRLPLEMTQKDVEAVADAKQRPKPTRDDGDTPRWLLFVTVVLVIAILGAAGVTIFVSPWQKGASKRWQKLVAPIVKHLP